MTFFKPNYKKKNEKLKKDIKIELNRAREKSSYSTRRNIEKIIHSLEQINAYDKEECTFLEYILHCSKKLNHTIKTQESQASIDKLAEHIKDRIKEFTYYRGTDDIPGRTFEYEFDSCKKRLYDIEKTLVYAKREFEKNSYDISFRATVIKCREEYYHILKIIQNLERSIKYERFIATPTNISSYFQELKESLDKIDDLLDELGYPKEPPLTGFIQMPNPPLTGDVIAPEPPSIFSTAVITQQELEQELSTFQQILNYIISYLETKDIITKAIHSSRFKESNLKLREEYNSIIEQIENRIKSLESNDIDSEQNDFVQVDGLSIKVDSTNLKDLLNKYDLTELFDKVDNLLSEAEQENPEKPIFPPRLMGVPAPPPMDDERFVAIDDLPDKSKSAPPPPTPKKK